MLKSNEQLEVNEMRGALAGFSGFFGAVCALIGLAHIAFGPSVIPGSIPVNATMDSEDRFYATLFLGFGLAMIWASRNLDERRDVYLFLMAVFFLGGLSRIISILAVGWPHPLFVFLTGVELILPIICWRWLEVTTSKSAANGSAEKGDQQ